MFVKRSLLILLFAASFFAKGQNVINDCGTRLSISADKKINDKFTIVGKIQARQAENFRLLNRVYFRLGLDYNVNEHFILNVTGNYMMARSGFKEMEKAFQGEQGPRFLPADPPGGSVNDPLLVTKENVNTFEPTY